MVPKVCKKGGAVANNPDDEAETTGAALAEDQPGEKRRRMCSADAAASSSFISPVKLGKAMLAKGASVSFCISPAGKSPSHPPAAGDASEPKRGTPEFWIARMDLAEMMHKDACNQAKSSAETLLPKLKSDADRRRLREHLNLRERCLRFWPDTILDISREQLLADAEVLAKAGVAFPISAKMGVLRHRATGVWKHLEDIEAVESDKPASAIALLKMFVPGRSCVRTSSTLPTPA